MAVLVAAQPGFATNFNLTSNSTTAQTLGSGSGQTGAIASGVSLTVSGGTVAVAITGNNATLTNNGTINQTGTGRAIRDNTGVTGLTVTNNAGALMQSADADVIQMNVANGSILFNNSGTLTSLNASKGGAQAVDFNAITTGSNTLNNFSTGLIQASNADAVRTGVNGIVNNSGIIKSTVTTDTGSDGIDAQNNTGANITNNATGQIEGARHGITGGAVNNSVTFTATVTNNAGGIIRGDNGSGINLDGFNANQTATIVNHGTITGNGVTGDGDGIDVDGVVNITNTGTIKSLNSFGTGGIEFSEGVTVGGGTIVNSGTIQGSVASGNTTAIGRGITIAGVDKDANDNPIPVQAPYAATTITNSGLIKGDSDSAIIFSSALSSGFSHTITNQAGGVIQTGGTTAAAILTAADNVTINNDGTIDGSSSGHAITGGSGNLVVNYNSGSILGAINGGSGTNTLNLGSGVTHAYGTANFQNVNVATGSATLAGIVSGLNLTKGGNGTLNLSAANIYTGTTTISAGTLTVNNTSGSATGTSSVQVQSGATLGGSGTISGPVTVDGIIAPGNSIGTLNVGNNVTWDGSIGNNWRFELGAGNTSDNLNIAGDFLKGLGSTFDFDFMNSATAGTYVLVDWSGSSNFLASDFSFVDLGGGLTGSFAINGNQLDFTAIPEPATTSLLAGAGVLAFALHLRRRRAALV